MSLLTSASCRECRARCVQPARTIVIVHVKPARIKSVSHNIEMKSEAGCSSFNGIKRENRKLGRSSDVRATSVFGKRSNSAGSNFEIFDSDVSAYYQVRNFF